MYNKMNNIQGDPPDSFMKIDRNFQSTKIMLKSLINKRYKSQFRNIVIRANKIRNDAYLFIKSYLLFCNQNKINFPIINKQFIALTIKVMGTSKKCNPVSLYYEDDFNLLNNYYINHFSKIFNHVKNDRYLLSFVENYIQNEILCNLETNLKIHFNKRLKKFIRFFGGKIYDNSDLPKNNKTNIINKLVKNIMFEQFDQIDTMFRLWFFINCYKLTKVFNCSKNNKIQSYLEATLFIAKKYENFNENLSSKIDEIKEDEEEIFFQIKEINDKIITSKKEVILIKKDKKDKKKLKKIKRLKNKIQNEERLRRDLIKQSDSIQLSKQVVKLFNILPLPNFNLNYITFDTSALHQLFITENKTFLGKHIKEKQHFIWEQIFPMSHKIFKNHGNFQFDYLIRTDGVGCSLLFRKIGLSKGFGVKLPDEIEYNFPKIEDLTPKQILSYNKVIAGDPGKKYLVYLGDTGDDDNKNIESYSRRKDFYELEPNILKYSNKQRIAETRSNKCKKILEKEKSEEVKLAEQELSLCCSKTVNNHKFNEYLITRHKHYEVLTEFYQRELWQKWKFRKFSNKQKSEDKFLNRIEDKYGKNTLIVLGDWSQSNVLKNGAPTLGVGMRKLLAKRFDVALINEYNTSKLCSGCHCNVEDVYIKGEKIFRLLGCKNCNLKNTTSETSRMKKVYSNYKYVNRDTNSIKNMLYIISEMVNNQMERPKAFSSGIYLNDIQLVSGEIHPSGKTIR